MSAIVIHGGAGKIRDEDRAAYLAGLERARDAGFDALENSGSAIAAVLAAVTTMENDRYAFNAGTGGAPTRDGTVECDAAIMSSDRRSGAVAAITRARNPILVADYVRLHSPHALVVGAGADALVVDPLDNGELLTDRTRAALERWRQEQTALSQGSGTVGAVAIDDTGAIAAATSTGGTLGQWAGRVGDSPLIGAGTYADTNVGISCTGKGEAFIRAVTAKTLACALESGTTLEQGLQLALDDVASQGADGGLIVLTAGGFIGVAFNSRDMAYAWRTAEQVVARVSAEPGVQVIGHPS